MQLVMTPLNQVDTAALYKLGSWSEDADGNEYQYCKGVVGTLVGSLVIIASDYTTTVGTAGAKGIVGFAMGVTLANQFGWYLRKGDGPCINNTGGVVAGTQLQTAAAGAVDDTTTAGSWIIGAIAGPVTAAGPARVRCAYPFAGLGL